MIIYIKDLYLCLFFFFLIFLEQNAVEEGVVEKEYKNKNENENDEEEEKRKRRGAL